MSAADDLAARFQAERPRLRAIAARLLGSAADGAVDDLVQEAWLRLARMPDPHTIQNLPAWSTTVVSRLALDEVRSARRARTRSWQVAAWPVEPRSDAPDPLDQLVAAELAGEALQLVLDRLSPAERIALLLHDVFGEPFERIADVLDRSPVAVRQLASRARRRVRGAAAAAPSAEDRRVVGAWLAAVRAGDRDGLLALLAPAVVLRADIGGRGETVRGVDDIAAQALLSARLAAHAVPVLVGGRPGVAAVQAGRVVSLLAFGIAAGLIRRLDVLADPAGLVGVAVPDGGAARGASGSSRPTAVDWDHFDT